MAEFRSDVDIANRALQHCGAKRLGTSGFSEVSKAASETQFCYGKLRQAELRRNVWGFATRRSLIRARDANTRLLAPALWAEGTTYFLGCIVADQYGNYWISNIPNNLGNDPLVVTTVAWEPYFGTLSVSLYDSDTTYSAGEVVYTTAGDGTARTYLSLEDGNADDPATATDWDADTVYTQNQVVTYSSVAYMSLIDFNENNTPSASAAAWASGTTYSAGQAARGSDGYRYTSVGNGNVGNDPVLDDGTLWTNTGVLVPWKTDFTGGTGSAKWLQIGGAEFPMGVGLASMGVSYPVGAGPSYQSTTRNVFKLPAGFLRIAPQNPKATMAWLGGPSGYTYNDWNFENGYLVTEEPGPIALRFVADVTNVRTFDPMFCELLAARIGLEVCEPLTQSGAKLATIAKVYQEWKDEAITANAIEQGYDDPPDDNYISVRI